MERHTISTAITVSIGMLLLLLGPAFAVDAPKGESPIDSVINKITDDLKTRIAEADARYDKQVAGILQQYQRQRVLAIEQAEKDALVRLERAAKDAKDLGSEVGEALAKAAIQAVKEASEKAKALGANDTKPTYASPRHAPLRPTTAPLKLVEEGTGFDQVKLGMTPERVLAVLGKPEERIEQPHLWLKYRQTKGIDIIFPHGVASEIRFNPGFPHRLRKGPAIGTPLNVVFAAYGKPKRTVKVDSKDGTFEDETLYELPASAKIIYGKDGVLFWFDGNRRVSQFVVFPPKKEPSTLQAKVSLVNPYPKVYPDAPVDRISVQYAVQVLTQQAKIEYNWDESFRNTSPVCQRWITPEIREKPIGQALADVLGPLGLSYTLRDNTITLVQAKKE